ncbi:hypothetical protein [Streptomyces sp. NBC_00154]|uniref:hypothetical protein n=1 Tax=Streptomyces sp. NBC_00154 TaxID=2975670 RepID=UPI002254B754|nr:hypothetical protein [Streptomyces sp. NBC_00154]MCX5316820.1 hypothetical protein [Streptomyces sp. NBC_00154]
MSAPIVVHGLSLAGGRAVTINDEIADLVYDDQGLIELVRRAGFYDAEHCLEDRTGSSGAAAGRIDTDGDIPRRCAPVRARGD